MHNYTVILFSLACLSKKVCLKNIHLVGWCVHLEYIYNIIIYVYIYVCCTALMRPNQAETVLSAVAYSLVPHDD